MAKKKTAMFEAPVEFGKLSIGEESASIRCTFSRERLSLNRADECLCNRRLEATLATGDGDEQPLLFDDMNEQISGVFEVKSFSVKGDVIGATLNITLAEVEVEVFSHFAGRKGVVRIEKAEEIKHDDIAPTPPVDENENWRDRDIEALKDCPGVTTRKLKALHYAGLSTIGRLADVMDRDTTWWHKNVKGISKDGAAPIEDGVAALRA